MIRNKDEIQVKYIWCWYFWISLPFQLFYLRYLLVINNFCSIFCIDAFVNSFMIRFEFAITLVGKHIGKIFFVALRFKIWRQVQNQVKFKLPSATIPTVGDMQQPLMIKLCCLHFKMMVVWKCWIWKQTECNWVSHQWYFHLGQSIFLCYKLSKYFYYVAFLRKSLCLLWRRSLSYTKQSIDSQSKSMDWFLYDRDFRHERVNGWQQWTFFANELINVWYTSDSLILI